MAPVRTYRSWLAALLLALYGFIALPVQLWHHHAGARCHTEKSSCSPLPAYGGESGSLAGSCKICDHQYAFYYNDQLAPFILLPAARTIAFSFYGPTLISSFHFHASNKGPPAEA